MQNNSKKAYTELTDFIDRHSEIEIGENVISILEDIRPEFYRLFNAVRIALIEERLPIMSRKAQLLSQNYERVEKETTALLELQSISTSTSLHRFLHEPMDELIRELYQPFFDSLRIKADIERFNGINMQKVEDYFKVLYRRGYEIWLVLSLVKLLEADKSLQVSIRQTLVEEEFASAMDESVPQPQESKCISFDHENEVIFSIPDLIIRSGKIGKYVSIRAELKGVMKNAINASEQRTWYPIDLAVALKPRLILIYVAEKPDYISLVADAEKICRPDLIIECREQTDWFEKEGLRHILSRYDTLKPKMGTFIVSMEPVSDQAYRELMPEQTSSEPKLGLDEEKVGAIHILTTGFDQPKLEPIISALMNQK